MSIEANKAIVRRLHEEFESGGVMTVADELLAPDLVTSRRPGRPPGPEGAQRRLAMLRTAFPDFHVTIEEMVAEEDRVAVRLTMRGTHLGVFRGTPPTGRRVIWTGAVFYRARDGRVVEQQAQFDTAALTAQIAAPGRREPFRRAHGMLEKRVRRAFVILSAAKDPGEWHRTSRS